VENGFYCLLPASPDYSKRWLRVQHMLLFVSNASSSLQGQGSLQSLAKVATRIPVGIGWPNRSWEDPRERMRIKELSWARLPNVANGTEKAERASASLGACRCRHKCTHSMVLLCEGVCWCFPFCRSALDSRHAAEYARERAVPSQ